MLSEKLIILTSFASLLIIIVVILLFRLVLIRFGRGFLNKALVLAKSDPERFLKDYVFGTEFEKEKIISELNKIETIKKVKFDKIKNQNKGVQTGGIMKILAVTIDLGEIWFELKYEILEGKQKITHFTRIFNYN